jgi:hypothetical protein
VSYANSPDGDTFSVKWTGYIKPDYTGTYTFYTTSDDGARLYVNGSTVINSWIDQGPTEHSGTIALTAGQWYPIELDFYENGGGAAITLSWSEASVSKQIIPAANLKPGTNDVKLNTSSVDLQGNGLANGLVGLWTFDGKDTVWSGSTAGTATDKSGNGNMMTLNGMTQSGSVAIGKMGQALTFNGSSSYLYQATFTNPPSSTMTICAWVKTAYSGGAQYILGLARRPSSVVNEGIYDIEPSGKQLFWDYTGSAYGFDVTTVSNTSVSDGGWHLVCFVKNGASGTYYRDGAADGTKTAANNVSYGASDWAIGVSYRDSLAYFNGAMDDVRVYNRALSAREVKQLYDMGK